MLHENAIEAIWICKYTEPFNSYIKTISLDPFFVEYWSDTQLNWYKKYTELEYSVLSFDATGGLVNSIKKPNGNINSFLQITNKCFTLSIIHLRKNHYYIYFFLSFWLYTHMSIFKNLKISTNIMFFL